MVFAFLNGWKKSKELFVISWKLYGIKISVSIVLFFTWGVWLFPTTMAALMDGWQKPKIFTVLYRKSLLSGALGCWGKLLTRRCLTRHQSHSIKLPFRVGVWGRCSGKLRAAVHCRSSVVLEKPPRRWWRSPRSAGVGHWGSHRSCKKTLATSSVSPAPSTDKASDSFSQSRQKVNLELMGKSITNLHTLQPNAL